jgi:DNA-binding transcriptional ArsR family regulator
MFQIIGAMAEFERALIQERVRAGLRNARAKGRRLGRPRVIVDSSRIASLRSQGRSWAQITNEAGSDFGLTISRCLYKVKCMDELNAQFAALADPTRRALLARLALGEATVNELTEPFDMTQPAISQHLKVLEDAGLIVNRVDGTRRPRRLARAGIEAVDHWLAMLRTAMEKNYQRLDEVLAGEKEKGTMR